MDYSLPDPSKDNSASNVATTTSSGPTCLSAPAAVIEDGFPSRGDPQTLLNAFRNAVKTGDSIAKNRARSPS